MENIGIGLIGVGDHMERSHLKPLLHTKPELKIE